MERFSYDGSGGSANDEQIDKAATLPSGQCRGQIADIMSDPNRGQLRQVECLLIRELRSPAQLCAATRCLAGVASGCSLGALEDRDPGDSAREQR